MKYNLNTPSDLRQMMDLLGAQLLPTSTVDPVLVMTTLRNVAMAATDKTRPLPDDVFAPGLNDDLCRFALSGMCMAMAQSLKIAQAGAMKR